MTRGKARISFSADGDRAILKLGSLRLRFRADQARALLRCLEAARSWPAGEKLAEVRTAGDLPQTWEVYAERSNRVSLRAVEEPDAPVRDGFRIEFRGSDVRVGERGEPVLVEVSTGRYQLTRPFSGSLSSSDLETTEKTKG